MMSPLWTRVLSLIWEWCEPSWWHHKGLISWTLFFLAHPISLSCACKRNIRLETNQLKQCKRKFCIMEDFKIVGSLADVSSCPVCSTGTLPVKGFGQASVTKTPQRKEGISNWFIVDQLYWMEQVKASLQYNYPTPIPWILRVQSYISNLTVNLPGVACTQQWLNKVYSSPSPPKISDQIWRGADNEKKKNKQTNKLD